MLKSTKFWLNVLLIVLSIALIILLVKELSKPEKAFNKVHLSHNNNVSNYTRMSFLDTVAYVGMDSLGLCEVSLYIKPLSNQAKENFGTGIELKATIFGHGDEYVMWIDDTNRAEAIKIVSHELIHLLQYKSREFIYEGFYVYWNGAKYDIKEMPYETRPWEVDAFEKQVSLERKIRRVLY